MSDEGGERISKLLPYKASKVHSRSYIKDDDLQIQLSQSKEVAHTENVESFKNIYAHYLSQVHQSEGGAPVEATSSAIEQVTREMEEAKLTYTMMMDISNQIADAYRDLKNLQ